jgi:hypothetical protein
MDTTPNTPEVVMVSKEVAQAAIELEQLRTFVANTKKRETELRKMILAEVAQGQDGYYQGHKVVAVKTTNRTELDKAGLTKAHPEVTEWFAEFTLPKPVAVVETF